MAPTHYPARSTSTPRATVKVMKGEEHRQRRRNGGRPLTTDVCERLVKLNMLESESEWLECAVERQETRGPGMTALFKHFAETVVGPIAIDLARTRIANGPRGLVSSTEVRKPTVFYV